MPNIKDVIMGSVGKKQKDDDELQKDFVNGLIAAGQGATLDFGDELYGLGGGLQSAMYGLDPVEGYKGARDEARSRIKQAETESPNAYLAGNIIGSALTPVPIPGLGVGRAALAGTAAAKPLAKVIAETSVKDASKKALQRIATSMGLGGVRAAGKSEADNLKDFASDVATGAVESADTMPAPALVGDAPRRDIGDVIDFKKMKDKLKKEKVDGPGKGDGWFTEKKVNRSLEREKNKKPTGDLGKLDAETRAENNRRAMKEAGLDRDDRKSAADIQKIDNDLNIAHNKVDREHTKIRNAPDYGENTYMNHGAFKEIPPSDEMDFISFAKAIEKGHKYHPEDAMKPLERDRWDIFRAQANMANASEAEEKLRALAGKHAEHGMVSNLIDDVKKNGDRWKENSERWSEDLADVKKRLDAGEKIPGYNHTPSFDDEADDFAKRAMADDSRFESFDDARAWYVKNWGPEAVAKREATRAKKQKNESLESMLRYSDEYKNARKASRGDDEVTWPRRDLNELPGEAKFTRGSNNKLTSVSDGPKDWETYAQALERGDKVKNPLATLDEKELEKFQLFASQAKALDQLQYADALEARTKKGGDLYDIKKRKIVTDIIKDLRKEASKGLSSFGKPWNRKRDQWNDEE